jgi:hypothetical protein
MRRSEARCDLIFKAAGFESRSKMREAKERANTVLIAVVHAGMA